MGRVIQDGRGHIGCTSYNYGWEKILESKCNQLGRNTVFQDIL